MPNRSADTDEEEDYREQEGGTVPFPKLGGASNPNNLLPLKGEKQ